MGSNRNTQISRGNYKKKFHPHKVRRADDKHYEKENIAPQESAAALDGSWIINLEQLAFFISDISSHSQSCEPGAISLVGETYRNGMASVLSARCGSCQTEIAFSTSL